MVEGESDRALSGLLRALRWRWRLAVLIGGGFMLGGLIAVALLPTVYQSSAVVAFSPNPSATTADANTLQLVLPKYVPYVTSPQVVREVATRTGLSQEELAEGLDARFPEGTASLEITVDADSAREAARAANALAGEAVSLALDDPLVSASVVSAAEPGNATVGPPRRLFVAAIVLLGILLGVLSAVFAEWVRPGLRSPEEFERVSHLPVLGAIPAAGASNLNNPSGIEPLSALAPIQAAFLGRRRDSDGVGWSGRPVAPRGRAVGVASGSRSDGGDAIALVGAEAAARSGSSVLLLDATTGSSARGGSRSGGGSSSTPRLVTKRSRTAGLTLARPARLGARPVSAVLPELLAGARNDYDLVLVTIPPLLEHDDGLSIVEAVEEVLLVARLGTPTGAFRRLEELLSATGVRVIGLVASEGRSSHRDVAERVVTSLTRRWSPSTRRTERPSSRS
jgi:capsular polysaccharide biosynthesis protein